MARKVAYSEQTVDTPNPIARFAHRSRYRLSLDRVADGSLVPEGRAVLDYGCGDGHFLNELAERRPDLSLHGFDPESNHTPDRYAAVTDMAQVPDRSIDLVCCFETLEHLYEPEVASFVDESHRVLVEGGRLLVSVPIIGGPPLLLKELNRVVLFRRRTDYAWRELAAASLLAQPAPRPENIRVTHKGFDFRGLADRLGERFTIERTDVSPFAGLPWWLNSQAFFLLRPNQAEPA